MNHNDDAFEEQESSNDFTPAKRGYSASAIHETDTSLSLRLPASRKMEWIEIVKGALMLIVILGLLGVPFFFTPEYRTWGIILAIALLIPTGYHWLYLFAGKEELKIERETIQVRYGIGLLRQSQKYSASEIAHLSCGSTTYQQRTQPFGPTKPYPAYVWATKIDSRTSAIVCDYKGQTISLLGWIDKPLAKHFLARAKKRFPNYV